MSSIAYLSYKATKDALKEMARQGLFRAAGNDTLRGISEQAVVGRFAARPTDKNEGDQGESRIVLPGIVVMHLRHSRPPTGGEQDYDDGVIQQMIQIVDRVNDKDDENIESYLRWQEDIRETLQTNPYRYVTHPHGCVYYAQVSDQVSPSNETFLLRQARLVLQVNLYTRTRINRETLNHGN